MPDQTEKRMRTCATPLFCTAPMVTRKPPRSSKEDEARGAVVACRAAAVQQPHLALSRGIVVYLGPWIVVAADTRGPDLANQRVGFAAAPTPVKRSAATHELVPIQQGHVEPIASGDPSPLEHARAVTGHDLVAVRGAAHGDDGRVVHENVVALAAEQLVRSQSGGERVVVKAAQRIVVRTAL